MGHTKSFHKAQQRKTPLRIKMQKIGDKNHMKQTSLAILLLISTAVVWGYPSPTVDEVVLEQAGTKATPQTPTKESHAELDQPVDAGTTKKQKQAKEPTNRQLMESTAKATTKHGDETKSPVESQLVSTSNEN